MIYYNISYTNGTLTISEKDLPVATAYPLWVGGEQVTEENATDVLNDGKVSFTPAEGENQATLTLNGANITTGYEDYNLRSGIYYTGQNALSIVLESGTENKIEGVDIGICTTSADLTVSGTGKITASGDLYGIYGGGTIKIEDGTITASSEGEEGIGIVSINVMINGGTITATNSKGIGIGATSNVTIKGCTVTANGIFGIAALGKVAIEGSTVTASANYSGILATSDVTIEGGIVEATGTDDDSYGIYSEENEITIKDGTVVAGGKTQGIYGPVKNAIAGTGWTDVAGTTGKADIAVSEDGQTLEDYKKVQFPAEYPLWVAGVEVTSANKDDVLEDGTVTFTPAEGENQATLTLNGANITTGYEDNDLISGIYYTGPDALNIVLESGTENNIEGVDIGIYPTSADLTISGTGKITASGVEHGIYGGGTIKIEEGEVTASETSDDFNAMEAGTIEISGGTVNVSAATGGDGIAADTVTINGGTVTATGDIGIVGKNVRIDGGTVNTSGQTAAILAYGNVTIEDGTVTASSEGGGIAVLNEVTIKGGTVTANGNYYGIIALNNVEIGGGTVTATGTDDDSYGIGSATVTIDSDSVVIAAGEGGAIYGPVKNAIAGTGWTDVEGTTGQTTIAANAEGQVLDYNKVHFPKVQAKITKVPKAKTLTYNGQEQQLVTAGEAEGGTMQYAIGKDATTAPTSGWSEAIPTGTKVGTYYVWYKVIGDEDHSGTEPACVTAKIVYPYIPPEDEDIKATVTFKVVNGSWDDGTATAKTLTLTGKKGDTLKLKAGDIPAVGNKPNEGYKAGSWDVEPDTKTAITKDTTYTYTYKKSTPEPEAWPFTDVKEQPGNWIYDAAKYVYDRGIMTGMGGTTLFNPAGVLSRGQFATIVYRMSGEEGKYKQIFPDVKESDWFGIPVAWCNATGVVTGYMNGLFGPGDDITREQLATMLYRYAEYFKYDVTEKADLSKYPDSGKVSSWAKEAMEWAVGSGIVQGKDGGKYLDPQGNASRAECATMVMRFMEKYVED